VAKIPKAKAVDDEVQVEVPAPAKQRGKRKASSRAEQVTTDVEIIPAPEHNKQNVSRAPSEARATATKSKPGKEVHRGGSIQPRQRHEEDIQTSDTAEAAPKKKKRKINLFPANAESTAFNFTPQVWCICWLLLDDGSCLSFP
jgi:hypothetical protein